MEAIYRNEPAHHLPIAAAEPTKKNAVKGNWEIVRSHILNFPDSKGSFGPCGKLVGVGNTL